MIRNSFVTKKRKKILKCSSGFTNSNLYKEANQKYIRSLMNQYIARKVIKRFFRRHWIKSINSILKNQGQKYSLFMFSLKKQNIIINRKILYLLKIYDLYGKKYI